MKRFLIFALVATMFASCVNDLFDQNGGSDKMPITISVEQTRANDVSFESGDQLGLYVVNYENGSAGTLASNGNHVNNMRFTLSSTWTPDDEVYWLDKTTKADFYAYYPYGYPSNVSAYPFSVNSDQSNEAEYWASDFLWGKRSNVAPTVNAVPLQTQHVFSNAMVYVVAGEGLSAEELAAANIEVTICNVKTAASINLATGVATATGNTGEITPWYTGEYYRAMIVPQTVSSSDKLLSVKINGTAYSHSTNMEFKANTRHQITVTVTADNYSTNEPYQVAFSIKEWKYDEVDYGGDMVNAGKENGSVNILAKDYEGADIAVTIPARIKQQNRRVKWAVTNSVMMAYNGNMPMPQLLHTCDYVYPAYLIEQDTILNINNYNSYRRNENGEIGYYMLGNGTCTEVNPNSAEVANGMASTIQYYYQFKPGEPVVLMLSEVDYAECTCDTPNTCGKKHPTTDFGWGPGWYWYPYDMESYNKAGSANVDVDKFWHEGAWYRKIEFRLPEPAEFDGSVAVNYKRFYQDRTILFTRDGNVYQYMVSVIPEGENGYQDITNTYLGGDESLWKWFNTSEVGAAIIGTKSYTSDYELGPVNFAEQFPEVAVGDKFHIFVTAVPYKYVDGVMQPDFSQQNFQHIEFEIDSESADWVLLGDDNGNPAKGKFRGNDLLTSLFKIDTSVEVDVNIYEHRTRKGYYKVEAPWTESVAYGFGFSSVNGALADGVSTTYADFYIDASNPAEVVFEQQYIGIDVGYGDMLVESGYPRYFDAGAGAGTMKEGVITFPVKGCIFALPGYSSSAYYANNNGMFRIMLPGVEAPDYSLAVEYEGVEVSADGNSANAKIKFVYGDTATGIKYMIVNGNIENNPSEALATLAEGTNENILSVENFQKGGKEVSMKIGLDSGVYSIVAAPVNRSGVLYMDTAAVKSFYFQGLGDSVDTACQFDGEFLLPSEFNPAYTTSYPDQTSLFAALVGKDIMSISYYFNKTSVIATWTDTPEALVAAYGSALDAANVELINSENGSVIPFNKLSEDTEYTAIFVATNIYGESKTLVLTKKTAAYEYTGELAVGQYYMSCNAETSQGSTLFENVFTLTPNGESETDYLVSDLGFDDGGKWKFLAKYDSAASTLTVDGTLYGYETYGSLFGSQLYGEYSDYFYTIFSFYSSSDVNGTDPIVFGVDPVTKQITSLQNSSFQVALFDSSYTYVGVLSQFDGSTTTIAPYSSTRSVKSVATPSTKSVSSLVKMPFSSVKINKSLVSKLDKTPSFEMKNIVSSAIKSSFKRSVKSVKPTLVENYAPAKSKGSIPALKADAEAIR